MCAYQCNNLFLAPALATRVYNNLVDSGYSDEDIFLIAANLTMLVNRLINNSDVCLKLTQTAIDIDSFMETYNNYKLC